MEVSRVQISIGRRDGPVRTTGVLTPFSVLPQRPVKTILHSSDAHRATVLNAKPAQAWMLSDAPAFSRIAPDRRVVSLVF